MKALQSLKLILPALIPSWNFFDIIAPSPRIQYILLNSNNEAVSEWQEFRPRPPAVSFIKMIQRIFYNLKWNESLYLVSCAERLMENYTSHSENEILNRIKSDAENKDIKIDATQLQFRLLYIHRHGQKIIEKILYTSRLERISQET